MKTNDFIQTAVDAETGNDSFIVGFVQFLRKIFILVPWNILQRVQVTNEAAHSRYTACRCHSISIIIIVIVILFILIFLVMLPLLPLLLLLLDCICIASRTLKTFVRMRRCVIMRFMFMFMFNIWCMCITIRFRINRCRILPSNHILTLHILAVAIMFLCLVIIIILVVHKHFGVVGINTTRCQRYSFGVVIHLKLMINRRDTRLWRRVIITITIGSRLNLKRG
mmetsp:Transcript_16787/g.26042  ORF Transcript_16787/g.26042 Transcript_16787/m.26042 type:complete len:224 (-) Transcript_16787:112-783(-)